MYLIPQIQKKIRKTVSRVPLIRKQDKSGEKIA